MVTITIPLIIINFFRAMEARKSHVIIPVTTDGLMDTDSSLVLPFPRLLQKDEFFLYKLAP